MQIMTVSAFLAYVNEMFKAVWDPHEVAIEGEVSGYRLSQGQWASFDLKDTDALVNVFLPIWKLHVPVQDGMRVRVFGFPRVYPKYGKFSFSAERVELAGEGALRKALAMLRQKFEQEGLFEPSRKRSLPRFPEHIALIASRESAAYGDFIRVLGERWGGLEIDLYHVTVQGERAPEEIVRAIQMVNAGSYDVLILTRGGGSLEELMAFNDERVVRAIYASKIPTLVGIGHERDISFAEEVADVRGSTPTDCARRLVPDRNEIVYQLATMQEQIVDALHASLDEWSRTTESVMDRVSQWLGIVKSRLDVSRTHAEESSAHWLGVLRERALALERLCLSLDPKAVLRRGYAIVRDTSGRVTASVKGLTAGTKLAVQLSDGSAQTLVQSVHPKP